MTLVPAWDTRTGKPLPHLVPDRWFGTALGEHLSPTDPNLKPKPVKPADPKKEA